MFILLSIIYLSKSSIKLKNNDAESTHTDTICKKISGVNYLIFVIRVARSLNNKSIESSSYVSCQVWYFFLFFKVFCGFLLLLILDK